MNLINFINKRPVISITVVIVIVFIIFITIINSNFLVDMKLYKQLYDDHIITEYIKNKKLDLSIGNKFTDSEKYRIPFIIYRTWKNKNLTEQFKNAWNKTAKYNPEFKQLLYTDLDVNNFINDFDYPGLKKAYNRINPRYGAARADLFRYAILYKNGGFYMDIKTYTDCSIKDKLGNDDAFLLSKWKGNIYRGNKFFFENHFLSFSGKLGEWEQYWLACEKEHPMMKAILDRCIENILNPKSNNLILNNTEKSINSPHIVFVTTGPLMMTYVVDNFIANNPDFKDYTITKPSFDNCIQYTDVGALNLSWLEHHNAYHKNDEKHYSEMSESLLIY